MEQIHVPQLDAERFESVLDPDRYRRFAEVMHRSAEAMRGRTIWNVNSTAQGGGVAEMLRPLLGYGAGAGIDARWLVVDVPDDFFVVTKRIHNRLHGQRGDGGPLEDAERRVYEEAIARNAREMTSLLAPEDVVVLHDPQTAGLTGPIKDSGTAVIWRCHVGTDHPNEVTRSAWDFLRPYVELADACVFSREAYRWEGLDPNRAVVIPPSIDAFSPKNQDLDERAVAAVLRAAGLLPGEPDGEPRFLRPDGSAGTVLRTASLLPEEPLPASAPLVLQVSRWDRLKDPVGVLRGFAHVPDALGAHLVLAGPRAASVEDDPEGGEVLREVEEAWRALPKDARNRTHLATLPMDDEEENAAIVNALQRRADVVVQKSLAEGFGLTVAEAMWKERCTVASRVGGIQDQIVHGESGWLLDDPTDLPAFGKLIGTVLQDREAAAVVGKRARERVRDEFLAPRHLVQVAGLIGSVAGSGPRSGRR